MRRSSSQRWLIPYADIMTLLFACFATLYAMTNLPGSIREQHADELSTLFMKRSEPEHEAVISRSSHETLIAREAGLDLVQAIDSLKLTLYGQQKLNNWVDQVSGSDKPLRLVCYVGMQQGGIMSAANFCGFLGEELVRRGIAARRLQIVNMGEGDPIASNLSENDAYKNFRVELIELHDDRQ